MLQHRRSACPESTHRISENRPAEDGPIAKFIEKKGEGIQHVAFAVEGLENTLAECEAEGIQLIDKAPRGGAEGLSIAFLHPKSTGSVLVELCEDKNGGCKCGK